MTYKKDENIPLFNIDELSNWKEEWKDMPEFVQEDLEAFKSVIVNFETREDMIAFLKLVGQTITNNTKSIWYPKMTYERILNKAYVDET